MNKLISIIIPTFNRAHLIEETLDSILKQTYFNWECIVVDDGSDDNTLEIISLYLERDRRFRYYERPANYPKGGNSCRNYGFELSKGAYIKWFDSDDIMYPDFLEIQMTILNNNKNLDFCASQWEYFGQDLDVVKNYINLKPISHPLFAYFLEGHVFATPSPLWKREFLQGKELFDLKLFRSQEADFHFRMLVFSPNYLLHEDFLYKVRRGHESIESSASNSKAKLSVLRYFQKAFKIIKNENFDGKKELLRYLIFRITRQTYSIISDQKIIRERIKFVDLCRYFPNYFSFLRLKTVIQLCVGFFLLIFFGKGYDLLNLKKFDIRKSSRKKILMLGPIGDFGGRELMSGFISNVLSPKYKIDILTTGNISSKSQVFEFNSRQVVFSLKDIIYNKSISIRILAFISYLKNNKKENKSHYVNNSWAKKYFNYEKKVKLNLSDIIKKYDLIFINAQLSSSYVKFIIEESKQLNKKIVFRTTGTIKNNQSFSYLNLVDLFIHHSESNADRLKINNHNYIVIDQCAFNENELLKISLVNSRAKNFLVIGRFEKEKNIDIVIESFLRVKSEGDMLYVIGDGSQLTNLTIIANNNDAIVFPGFVSNNKLKEFFLKIDCVIISSSEESGPLVGIESMASGKLLLSTKVGAMPERLKDIQAFWFDKSVESLSEKMIQIKSLNEFETNTISNQMRNKYLENYSKDTIATKYQNALSNLFK